MKVLNLIVVLNKDLMKVLNLILILNKDLKIVVEMIYSKVLELYLPARQWSPFRKLVKRKGDVISGLVGSFILVKSCS